MLLIYTIPYMKYVTIKRFTDDQHITVIVLELLCETSQEQMW